MTSPLSSEALRMLAEKVRHCIQEPSGEFLPQRFANLLETEAQRLSRAPAEGPKGETPRDCFYVFNGCSYPQACAELGRCLVKDGVRAEPGTLETERDPRNPNLHRSYLKPVSLVGDTPATADGMTTHTTAGDIKPRETAPAAEIQEASSARAPGAITGVFMPNPQEAAAADARAEIAAVRALAEAPAPLPTTLKTPCCGFKWSSTAEPDQRRGPIFWNELNKAVQCHACGQSFSPLPLVGSADGGVPMGPPASGKPGNSVSTRGEELPGPSASATPTPLTAETVWASIERLLVDECGLLTDQGLAAQRSNIISAIRNLEDPALKIAAADMLEVSSLGSIRIHGRMMRREDVAAELRRAELVERRQKETRG